MPQWILSVGRFLTAPFRVVGGVFRALLTEEGRRAWAVVIAWGCGVSMTVYASAALFLDRDHAAYVFWLGLAAMGIILVVMTAITGLLIKREIGGSVNLPGGGGGNVSLKDQ